MRSSDSLALSLSGGGSIVLQVERLGGAGRGWAHFWTSGHWVWASPAPGGGGGGGGGGSWSSLRYSRNLFTLRNPGGSQAGQGESVRVQASRRPGVQAKLLAGQTRSGLGLGLGLDSV